jgi:hypothetical protein
MSSINCFDNSSAVYCYLNRIANVHSLPLHDLLIGFGLVGSAEESANVLDNLVVGFENGRSCSQYAHHPIVKGLEWAH